MSGPGGWLDAPATPDTPQDPEPGHVADLTGCPDPDCGECRAVGKVAETGARALCTEVDVDFDSLDDHGRAHYMQIAATVMAAMSEAMLDTGLARSKETPDATD